MSIPRRKRWTVAEFHRLCNDGWFDHCRPALLDGEILEMPIPGPLHNMSTTLGDYKLKAVFGTDFVVRVQMQLVLGLWTDPIPDLAVVRGSPFNYTDNPSTAVLVAEIADISLTIDLDEKACLYAAAGIADYWVIDLNHRCMIVHRDPQPDPLMPMQSSYRTLTKLLETDSVQPLAASTAVVQVIDLLPK